MSDQDEIAKLLAEANAQSESNPPTTDSSAPQEPGATPSTPPQPAKRPPRIVGKNDTDVLGVAWFNGTLQVAVFHRQKMGKSWSAPAPVKNVAEFEAVVDDMLAEVEFTGTEMFLLLENELFTHQTETIPSFSAAAARSYLKGRILRHEQEHGPVLWVNQPTAPFKNEQAIILHLLPTSFYDELNKVLLARHLDLTRIIPIVVPIQYELNKIPAGKDTPVITIAETGPTSCIVVGKIAGPLLFARTVLADVNREAGRIGVEVNRSLLFAKQHHDCAIDRIWMMTQSGSSSAEISAKCGATRKIMVLPTTPIDWLQTTIKLSPQQPINLLAGYLKRKNQHRLIRYSVLAAGWIGLLFTIFSSVDYSRELKEERSRMASLRRQEHALSVERTHLLDRNTLIEREKNLISQVANDRLPPIPSRLIGYIASILPPSARLTDFSIKRDSETYSWTFRVDGLLEADEETARELTADIQHQLERSPFHAQFAEPARAVNTTANNLNNISETQRFFMEGSVREK